MVGTRSNPLLSGSSGVMLSLVVSLMHQDQQETHVIYSMLSKTSRPGPARVLYHQHQALAILFLFKMTENWIEKLSEQQQQASHATVLEDQDMKISFPQFC